LEQQSKSTSQLIANGLASAIEVKLLTVGDSISMTLAKQVNAYIDKLASFMCGACSNQLIVNRQASIYGAKIASTIVYQTLLL
jgi:hypothetical protein